MNRNVDDEIQAYLDGEPALDAAAAQRWRDVDSGAVLDPEARDALRTYREVYSLLVRSRFEFASGFVARVGARLAEEPAPARLPLPEFGLLGLVILLTVVVLIASRETVAASWLGVAAPWLALAGTLAALSELAELLLLRKRTTYFGLR